MPEDKTMKPEGIQLDSLNLRKDENLKLEPGALGSFLSGQVDVMSFGKSDPESYTKYDVTFSRFRDPDMDRAKNQTRIEQAFNALGRIGLEGAIGEGVSGIGSLFEVVGAVFGESETDFNNAIIELGEGIKETAREAMPIYRERPSEHFDMTDFAWWADNSVSIGSTLGLLIPATGLVKGVSMLGKGLSALGKSGKFAKGMSQALQIYDKTGDAAKYWGKVVGTSVGMRHAENFGESLQTYNTVKQESMELFNDMSDVEFENWKGQHQEVVSDTPDATKEGMANHIANKAGWQTYKADAANLAFDMIQVMPLFKGFKYNTRTRINPKKVNKAHYASMGQDLTKEVARKQFRQRLGTAITTGLIAQQLTEGIEETINAISQQEGVYYGKKLLGTSDNKKFDERLSGYLKDPATWEQAFWGVMGGVAFSGGVSGLNKARNIMKGVPNDRADAMRISEIAGRNVELSKSAKLLHVLDNNINPYTGIEFEGTPEQIKIESDKVRENIIADTALQLGIGAAKHGNVNLLLEQLQSDQFKKEITEKYGLANEVEVKDVIDTISKNVVRAENLYKTYYNKFATEKISEPIKDLLITDAIWLEQNRNAINTAKDIANDKVSNLRNQTAFIELQKRIDKSQEGKTSDESLDLEDSIRKLALRELGSQITLELLDVSDVDIKSDLITRLEKYKQKIVSEHDKLKGFKGIDLAKGGLDHAIIEHEAEIILQDLLLEDNSNEFKDLLGSPKEKAKEKEEAIKDAAEADTQEAIDEVSKAIDETDDADTLDKLSNEIDNLISENVPFKDKFKPLKDKISAKVSKMKRDAKIRESVIKEKETYIKDLRNAKGTPRIRSVMNKMKNEKFTKQFNEADLAEINAVLDKIKGVDKKKEVETKVNRTLSREYVAFISKVEKLKLSIFPIAKNISEQGKIGDTIKLTGKEIATMEKFKSDMVAIVKEFSKYESLGSTYTTEFTNANNFINMINKATEGKTVVNLDGDTKDIPSTSDTISDDELVKGFDNIINNHKPSDTLKASIVDEQAAKESANITQAISIIRLLALKDAGLGRNDKLKDSNFPFNKVLRYIHENVNDNVLSDERFVDTMRNIYNIAVNAGYFAKNQYVTDRVDISEYISKPEPIQELTSDVDVFISSLVNLRKPTRKDGDIIVSKEEKVALEEIMDIDIDDTVQVEVDKEKSKERSTDYLQADVKITRKGKTLFHLNRIYNIGGTNTMFIMGMSYTANDNWTDVVTKALMEGKFAKEYELLSAIKSISERTHESFSSVLDLHGQDLINSAIIVEAINMGTPEPITRESNKKDFDSAIQHMANVLSESPMGTTFNATEVTNSLSNWNNRIKSDIVNTLGIRNQLKAADGNLNIKVTSKQVGGLVKAVNQYGNPIFKKLSDTYGNPDDIVLLHTKSHSDSVVHTVNGKELLEFEGKFHKGTIYTLAKVATANGIAERVVPTYTTDITDDRISTAGKAYNEKLVKFAVKEIKDLTNQRDDLFEADVNEMIRTLGNHILGVERNTTIKLHALSFDDKYGTTYTITIGKNVTSLYTTEKDKDRTRIGSKDEGFDEALVTAFSKSKRNVPIRKLEGRQNMEQYNEFDGATPVYHDAVTGKQYKSFTHYAIDTELLITPHGAIKDKSGNIVSHNSIFNSNSFEGSTNMKISLSNQGEKIVKKEAPKVETDEEIFSIINDEKSPYKELFDIAKEAGAIFDSQVVQDDTYYAGFNSDSKLIHITSKFKTISQDNKYKVLAHEAIHAIVDDKITDEQGDRLLAIVNELNTAFSDGTLIIPDSTSKEYIGKILDAMLSETGKLIVSEVLTYTFTDKAFANTLNANKSDKGTGKESLWDKFIKLIADIIPGTKLSEIKDIMDDIMGITTKEVTKEVKEEAKDEFEDLGSQPLDDTSIDDNTLFAKVEDGSNNYLGTSIAGYMRSKSKGERDFIRNEINKGNIVLKCK